jgi:hypothetical protein
MAVQGLPSPRCSSNLVSPAQKNRFMKMKVKGRIVVVENYKKKLERIK